MNNVSLRQKGYGTTVTNYNINSLVNPEVIVKLGKRPKVIDTPQGVPDNITRARRRGPAIYRAAWGPGAAELWGFTL